MPNKVSYIVQLKDRFSRIADKISDKFKKVNINSKKASDGVGGLSRKLDSVKVSAINANKRLKDFLKTNKDMFDLSKSLAKIGTVMTLTATVPIALLSRSMVNAASDAVETGNKFDAVFSKVKGNANKVANDFSKSFGVAGSTARELIGNTGDLLTGFGFTGKEALKMSKAVNELSADLTSFQNIEGGIPRASEALTKAILGETEMAKMLGIVVRQNTKEFKGQVRALMQTRGLTEQQAKALLILKQAQEQSKNAIGDTAKTWNEYASVTRRNKETTKDLKEQFGKILLPAALKLQLGLAKLFKWIGSLSTPTKKIILVLGGVAAIAGPITLVVAALAASFALLSLPVLLVSAAIVGLIAAGVALVSYWSDIKTFFINIWDGPLKSFNFFYETVKNRIASMIAPVSFLLEKLGVIDGPVNAPSAPTANAGGSINGNITVAAEKGSEVKNTSITTFGNNLNVGMNMATQ